MIEATTSSHSSLAGSLRDVLLVQCRPKDLPVVTEMVTGDPGCGVVLTETNPLTARQRVRHLQQQVPAGRILLDSGACAGTNRKWARAQFSPNWISLQRDLGLWVLPDAGYVDEGDIEGLRSILRRAGELGPDVIAPLGLHKSWFERIGLPTLIEAVGEANVPVALMLEHKKDPFSVAVTLRGALQLIRESPQPVIFLRCDLSSIGLLCHGAHAAAVGTTTGLRHIYPLPTKKSSPPPPKVSAVVRECLSYVSLEKIVAAVQAEPDNQMWVCGCRSCNGETIDQIYMRGDRETAAFIHSIEMLRELRAGLMVDPSPVTRTASWASQCDDALFRAEEMTAIDPSWPSPRMLAHWTAVHPAIRQT